MLAGAATLVARRQSAAAEIAARATRGLPSPKIKDVKVIATSPAGLRLVVVKVTTDQAGLYGYGCATFTQRADLVVDAVERYLKPFVIGRAADRIEDIWQASYMSSYWRNGPVLNNALSGIDMALWDIKGRQAGLPVYQLLGGKVREAADVYMHAQGPEIPEVIEHARSFIAKGVRHVRVQVGLPGYAAYAARSSKSASAPVQPAKSLHGGPVFEPIPSLRRSVKLLEEARKQLGDEVHLIHDIHERVHPTDMLQWAGAFDQFKLFWLEQPVSPEDIPFLRLLRTRTATPLADGEQYVNPQEWMPIISERLLDYMRFHPSFLGGLTPSWKLSHTCEAFGIRMAWHGPGDLSPVGLACNVGLDLAIPNFGVQEYSALAEATQEVFSGSPTFKDGYLWANEAPGWGIEVNEKAAAKYPFGHGEDAAKKRLNGGWGDIRRRDGTVIKP